MEMRRLLLLPALAVALGGCWGSTSAESAATPTAAQGQVSSSLERSLEAELARVEEQLLSSSDEALLDRRLVILAALSALDRAAPGEPPTTWSKDQLLAAMRAQLERMGRDDFSASLEGDLRRRDKKKSEGRRKSRGSHDKPVQDRFRGLFGDGEEKPNLLPREDDDGILEEEPEDELARGGADPGEIGGEDQPPPDGSTQRQAAMVQTGQAHLSAEARAAIRRQLPRVQQCVPSRSVRTQVRVRAQLHQGRLRAPAVSADPPVAAAVSGCIVEALSAIEVPIDPDAPIRVVAFPFVVEAR